MSAELTTAVLALAKEVGEMHGTLDGIAQTTVDNTTSISDVQDKQKGEAVKTRQQGEDLAEVQRVMQKAKLVFALLIGAAVGLGQIIEVLKRALGL